MNIPIYRARQNENGEYIEGCLLHHNGECFIIPEGAEMFVFLDSGINIDDYEIDPSTLAIHFPDMLDKNGERVFAAFNKSWVGGSEVRYDDSNYVVYYLDAAIVMSNTTGYHEFTCFFDGKESEVTGIYEG